ncbi:MAG: OsmC family protein [Methylocystaceae bacterium]
MLEGQGYTPMELLLTSLASCSGATVVSILQKKHKQIDGFKVTACGTKRPEPPGAFQQINLHFDLQSPDAAAPDLERSIQLAEEKHCPVWAMLKGNVEITTNYSINQK